MFTAKQRNPGVQAGRLFAHPYTLIYKIYAMQRDTVSELSSRKSLHESHGHTCMPLAWSPCSSCLLRLAGTQQKPGLNLAPLQSKEWHLQWHVSKKSLGRQSISEMVWHSFLPVSFFPNAINLLQAFIRIELLPCHLQLRRSS